MLGTGSNPYKIENVKNEQGILIQKGNNFHFDYISDQPEKKILKKLKWKVIGGILGGSLLSILCLS